MIDLLRDEILTLADAARFLPPLNGKRPHTSTLWRWVRRGIGPDHIRLEHLRVGRRIVTSARALTAFAEALARADAPPSAPAVRPQRRPPSGPRRAAAVDAAERRLSRAGI